MFPIVEHLELTRLYLDNRHFSEIQELTGVVFLMALRMHSLSVKQKTDMNTKSESTYSMLVRSQEKGRTLLEILVFVLCVFSVVVVIWQFAETSLKTFEPGIAPCIACDTSAPNLPAGG